MAVMLPKLEWVLDLQASINRATDGQLTSLTVLTDASPLKFFLKFGMQEELSPKSYHPFCTIARAFAISNDCMLERVRRGPRSLTLEVAIKRRLGPSKRINPLLLTKK